jgi:predicted  nucleic acid-binding Zn-ribbon protein
VNAAPEVQLRLLDLQALDSTLDRLAHRRATLPEIVEVEDLQARARAAADLAVAAETEDNDLARAQRKIEADVELVTGRMQRDRSRLDTGQVSSPKELENLQSEVASLTRRRSDLEDQVLELMEQREGIGQRLREATGERERLAEAARDAEARRDSAIAEIDAEAGRLTQQRKELAGTLPADLLALYEKIRQGAGGVGAAALHRGRCEGCHLQLNTVDINELRGAPADAVLRCEECRRILVRTPDSGL